MCTHSVETEVASRGRPSKYNEQTQAKADEYIASLPDGQVIHTVEGLADYIDVARATVYRWADEHPLFRDTLEEIMRKQAISLINNALTGEFNSPFTKMLMNANHGYRERTEVDTTSSDGSMTPQVIERVIIKSPHADS